jgi:hypothetical protein
MAKWHPIRSSWIKCPYCHRIEWNPGNVGRHEIRLFKWGIHMNVHYKAEQRKPWNKIKGLFGKMKFYNYRDIQL